jgi:tRNA-uridine 2-sulfurtransferase
VKVLVAMSGGVDSSVAAALAVDAGHQVVGVTLKLWGGPSDRGCCSVADVDDARRVADRLGIDHHVFNFADDFEARVVAPYVAAHEVGRTPNPCIECNRHLKFDRLLQRARALGFDALATGHHARVVVRPDGRRRLARGTDAAKDQSYVLYMLGQEALSRVLLPVGELTKEAVRQEAARRGLRTATKPDSQEVCFITAGGGREAFLGGRIDLRPARVVDREGRSVGVVTARQLVTIGQRRGLGTRGGQAPRYVVDVDVGADLVTVGDASDLKVEETALNDVVWTDQPAWGPVLAQCSAHGTPRSAVLVDEGGPGRARLRWDGPQRRVAPGQAVVFYQGEQVLGGGLSR